MKKKEKKTKKVFNPVTGKYLSVGESVTLALLLNSAPQLVARWRGEGSKPTLPFHEWLSNIENNEPIKGFLNKIISKNFASVVGCLIAKWQESDIENFDDFLELCHTRVKATSPRLNK